MESERCSLAYINTTADQIMTVQPTQLRPKRKNQPIDSRGYILPTKWIVPPICLGWIFFHNFDYHALEIMMFLETEGFWYIKFANQIISFFLRKRYTNLVKEHSFCIRSLTYDPFEYPFTPVRNMWISFHPNTLLTWKNVPLYRLGQN